MSFLKISELKKLRKNGVIFEDIKNVYISTDSIIERNVKISAGTKIESSIIHANVCFEGQNLVLNSEIGCGTIVNKSEVTDSIVGEFCTVGPYAHIKQNSKLKNKIRVGNYVEIKNSVLGSGCKCAHLTYIGDAEVGENVNFGCGVVFANYDGKTKHKTKVGNNVFVGCNCNLIAPLSIGDDVFIAAGTTVCKDVENNKFVIGRVKESVKEKK